MIYCTKTLDENLSTYRFSFPAVTDADDFKAKPKSFHVIAAHC